MSLVLSERAQECGFHKNIDWSKSEMLWHRFVRMGGGLIAYGVMSSAKSVFITRRPVLYTRKEELNPDSFYGIKDTLNNTRVLLPPPVS